MAIVGGGSGGGVSGGDWDTIKRIRDLRIHNFEVALNAGLSSTSSTVTINSPAAGLFTGGLTATPSSKGREMGERTGPNIDIWTGIDTLNYYGRKTYLSCYMGIGTCTLQLDNAVIYAGIFMEAPGIGPWSTTPGQPYVMLLYKRLNIGASTYTETWELWTAPGAAGATLVSTLTGVAGPKTSISPGGQQTQRLEIIYDPGVSVSAYIDGILGVQHTTNLPTTTLIPSAQVLAGVGCWVENGQIADGARADFHSLIVETYRP